LGGAGLNASDVAKAASTLAPISAPRSQNSDAKRQWLQQNLDRAMPVQPDMISVVGGAAGYLDDGLSALREAQAAADEHENCAFEADIHRLKGDLLLRQNDSNAAEAQSCFQRAIEIARNQSAKSWELRATTSLARLLNEQGKHDEARTMLAEIYGWFTEGFGTADLKDAKALLDELRT